ncbi:MAG: hypothetical protein NC340_06035 [Ruminococcus flavefaciens]|nr:hypothetical protein [Ruminococcus flavefaciens]MCM1231229.1 hypothetical protein [Ruminococcus flavefaciens]
MKLKKLLTHFGFRTERLGVWVVGILSVMFSLFVCLTSLLHTTTVENIESGQGRDSCVYRIREDIESVIYYNDNLFVNLIILAVTLVLCFVIAKKCSGIRLRYILSMLFIWTATLGTVWVISSQSAPTYDSQYVSDAAIQFAEGNYTMLTDWRYFKDYSFQLGYVMFNELIVRIVSIFKPETPIYFEVANAFFLAVINIFIVMINHALFNDRRITNLTAFILALSVSPILSCSFIYGIFPGMMFAVIAVYFEIKYLQTNKIYSAVISGISIALAVFIKSNYLIWLIAMMCIAGIKLFRRRHYIKDIIYIIATVAVSMNIQSVAISVYEHRADCDLGDSVPYVSWIAMGINESMSAPGWFNYVHTTANLENSNYDAEVAGEKSKENIKERIKYFIENPQYANDFFYLKAVSQWNDTSYESIWNNTVRGQYAPKNAFAEWVCYDGSAKVKKYMDFFSQLVFFGFLAGCVYTLKNKKFTSLFFPIIFIGGFMYHLMSEGKSQYIIPYFILMSGFSAYGIVCILDSGIPSQIKNKIFRQFKKERKYESA